VNTNAFALLFEAKFNTEKNILIAQDKLRLILNRKKDLEKANIRIQAQQDQGLTLDDQLKKLN
jgi:hypothetical protein